MKQIMVEISIGDLIDRWTILMVKETMFKDDPEKLVFVQRELEQLHPTLALDEDTPIEDVFVLGVAVGRLRSLHEALWVLEEDKRALIQDEVLDQSFIDTCVSIATYNDERAKIKREINERFGSQLREVKSHAHA